jgi:hypothetical protein
MELSVYNPNGVIDNLLNVMLDIRPYRRVYVASNGNHISEKSCSILYSSGIIVAKNFPSKIQNNKIINDPRSSDT